MQQGHLLCARPDCGDGAVLYEQLQKASIVEDRMVYGIVFVHDEVYLLGTCNDQLLDTVPSATLTCQMQQRLLGPKRYPWLLHLLRHHA